MLPSSSLPLSTPLSSPQVFPNPSDREQLKQPLQDLSDAATAFRQLATAGVQQLAGGVGPRLRASLDLLSSPSLSYSLSEAQYAEHEANDPWAQRLLVGLEGCLAPLRGALTAANHDSLVGLVAEVVARRVETALMAKRFNALGALQLDREVRALTGHVSAMSARSVRDKFARLSQVRREGGRGAG